MKTGGLFLSVLMLSACSVPREQIISVQLDPVMENGEKWDLLGGPPDPYVIVNGKTFREHACEDSYKCSFRVKGSWYYHFEVFDRDEILDGKAGSVWCLGGDVCRAGSADVKFEER